MSFMDKIKNAIDEDYNFGVTENGALGYKTSGKELVDLNFSIGSMRMMSDKAVYAKFLAAFFEDRALAMRWLFYARDVRNGLGERRLFRVVLKGLANDYPEMVTKLIPLVADYGRYDDLWVLLDNKDLCNDVVSFASAQLKSDVENYEAGKSISLLAKWMPSCNASSEKTKEYAHIMCSGLCMTERTYRRTLSALRSYSNVIECKMSAREWNAIMYEAVPSRANLIYNSAFLRNDEVRRRAYLAKLEKGEAKINAATLFPHDIVHKYSDAYGVDTALESMWKSLPDLVKGNGNTIVVADGSGSMNCKIDRNSKVTALDVAIALAVYFAERSSGEFRDRYITFSGNPRLVNLAGCRNLKEKISEAKRHNECANTNIEKVFELILNTAVRNHMRQEDMPRNILIISDMEFDTCATTGNDDGGWYSRPVAPTARLFNVIARRYEEAGYKLPRLVFWNTNSRSQTIPVRENDLGVALVSGFSVNICKMVMSGKTDAFECLVETLMDERYNPVIEAIQG